ncbi:MAG TPA: BON domain-containing protein [Candidatus Acidoferrales bacterium]|nr:BON domain-containing protein [Candidatus Acidoferrales bacterium]
MKQITRARTSVLFGASVLMGLALLATPKAGYSAPPQDKADNSKMNKGDASKDATTADQQKMNPTDRAITQKIRAEIMKDKSLSTYAHNVKIITQDGKVTLKGPVRTSDEKSSIEAKASAVAGDGNVTSQIEIVPPKS